MSVLDKYNKGNRFEFEAPEDFEFVKPKELFENEDVISRDYWREKLYESLIEKK